MDKVVHGVVHGQTILLREPPGATDGEEVELVIRFCKPSRPWGEGIRASAGALADQWSEEDDLILAQIQHERRLETRLEIPPL